MALPFLILSSVSRAPAPAGGPNVYRPGGAHRTFSAALALAIAGGVGASLVLALVVPAFVAPDDEGLIVINTPVETPKVEPDKAKPAEPTRSVITLPPRDPIVTTNEETRVIRETFPPIDTGPVIGAETVGGGIVLPDPPHTPVFRAATRNPRFADRFQPAYPSARERDGIEGRCPVTVTIAPSGQVSSVVSNGCTDSAFFAATERQALRHWRFRPATRDGVAVESTQDIAVTFQMPRR